jgi:hypothetical protein
MRRVIRSILRVIRSGADSSDTAFFAALREFLSSAPQAVRVDVDKHLSYLAGRAGVTVDHLLDGKSFRVHPQVLKDAITNISRAMEGACLAVNAERAALLLSLVTPEDAHNASYVRVGNEHDGGYVMVAEMLKGGVAYSCGILDDVSWDRAMADRGYEVFQYDHTISALPEQHRQFRFFKTGICGLGKDDHVFRSLDTLVRQNGHENRDDLVLKIDIEGAEWDVFSTMLDETIRCFSQIVVEFHALDKAASDPIFLARAYAALSKLDAHFVPVHVHANNSVNYAIVGSFAVPPVLEVTYLRRGAMETGPCTRLFPTELDRPNTPSRPDLWLGSFQFPVRASVWKI